jgi:hypothetical protein
MSPITDANWNGARMVGARRAGFYESYFQRANHPARPLGFWIRYTAFSPAGHPEQARGELWAIYFDGEAHTIVATRTSVPLADCEFSPSGLGVRIGDAMLAEGRLRGASASASHTLEWALTYEASQPPLLLFPEPWYERGLPKAKVVIGAPNAVFQGTLTVDGRAIAVGGWRGSQNHNWGSKHTDRYAWGQVAGFDNAPDAFLECSTAQIKLGPLWSPRLTLLVLRLDGEEFALNTPWQALRAAGRYHHFQWTFASRSRALRIAGTIHAEARAFVGLTYQNPPGGTKTCLNSKIASAEITVTPAGRAPRVLTATHRAAFEILTDRVDHGVPIAS